MVLYLLGEPYKSENLGRQLQHQGYSRVHNNRIYKLNGLKVNLSDPNQGKVTIEGCSLESCKNFRDSKHYDQLEQLARIFKPKFIKNESLEEIAVR